MHGLLCILIYWMIRCKDSFSKCDQIRSFLQIWSHLLKKPIMENLQINYDFLPIYFICIGKNTQPISKAGNFKSTGVQKYYKYCKNSLGHSVAFTRSAAAQQERHSPDHQYHHFHKKYAPRVNVFAWPWSSDTAQKLDLKDFLVHASKSAVFCGFMHSY